ncbi:Trafficking protein particle complex subunit 2 [Hondaea fermentalgiana]|uniref:Trafficking protein particle complex subunit 2 n=1 Tax=Hondaea fermentalgiana TaxID=2315210 RepID=A0A2R5GL16_9STRA|nr:Trafficking protein particle complex subunit 2 [Hondaea fermentalgiana]|eukprot:GBG28971.1 Trafficking protein particle complex subunit 2 [Hondaea fermentalgiana]
MALAFAVVGAKELVYECRLSAGSGVQDQAHVHQFVMHSALDMVEERMWQTSGMYLRVVDEFNDFQVHAWVAANGAKLLLLHKTIAEDSGRRGRVEEYVRGFFEEVNDLYTKVALNPFYELDQPIDSEVFDARVRSCATKYGL